MGIYYGWLKCVVIRACVINPAPLIPDLVKLAHSSGYCVIHKLPIFLKNSLLDAALVIKILISVYGIIHLYCMNSNVTWTTTMVRATTCVRQSVSNCWNMMLHVT